MEPGVQVKPETNSTGETSDRSALLLMLAYVEAECRRLGADAAARHAAMAAALVPELGATRFGAGLH
jgi:hypothetical protein